MSEFTYESVLANHKKQIWFDGERSHKVKSCECDKCKQIKQNRISQRDKYLAEYRNANRGRLHKYQKALRSNAESVGRPRYVQLAWCGSPWIDEDLKFFEQVKEFSKRNSMSVNQIVKSAVNRFINREGGAS